MELNDYQKAARLTAVYPEKHGLSYTILGLTNEAGEVAGKLKKYLRSDMTIREAQLAIAEELGDVLWYVAMVAFELNVPLDAIAQDNLIKLQDRKNRDVIRGSGDKR